MDAKIRKDLETLRLTILRERARRSYNIGAGTEDTLTVLQESYKALVNATGHDMSCAPDHLSAVARWLCGQGRSGLLLYGGYGTGKTTTLRAIQYTMRFLCPDKPIRHYLSRQVIEMNADDLKSLRIGDALVMVDELGREQNERREYGNISEPLIEIIRYREDKGLPTILASNLVDDEFSEKYGPYIRDRLFGSFSRIYYDGKSFRGNDNVHR